MGVEQMNQTVRDVIHRKKVNMTVKSLSQPPNQTLLDNLIERLKAIIERSVCPTCPDKRKLVLIPIPIEPRRSNGRQRRTG